MRKKRFIYNNDGSFILSNARHAERPITPADVEEYVDMVTGTQVTTFFICTNCSMPYYASRYERAIGCVTNGTAPATGHPHPGDDPETYGRSVRALARHGTDIVELCVSHAHAAGLEAFATMRMNDLHFNDPAIFFPQGQGDFWLKHAEYHMGEGAAGWHANGALNFAHEAVRTYKLNMMAEICEKFDIDGIELDFLRFPVYFPDADGQKHIPEMTDFIRKARQIANDAGKARGRAMEFGTRIPMFIDACTLKGFDPVTYAAEGLVDFLTIGPFLCNCPTVPVAAFRDALGTDRVPLYAGIEDKMIDQMHTAGHYRASAANRWREGADGMYLFNHFYGQGKPRVAGQARVGPATDLLDELGDPETLVGRNKVYFSGRDTDNFGVSMRLPTPKVLAAGERVELNIESADDVSRSSPERLVALVRTRGGHDGWTVTWNDTEPAFVDAAATAAHYGQNADANEGDVFLAYELPRDSLRPGANRLTIQAPPDAGGKVLRADLVVDYGPVASHGYF